MESILQEETRASITLILRYRGKDRKFKIQCKNEELEHRLNVLGFTRPSQIQHYVAYCHEPMDFYYRMNAYFHWRYAQMKEDHQRKMLWKCIGWPKDVAQKNPLYATRAVLVAFHLNNLFIRMGLTFQVEDTGKAALDKKL